MRAKLRSMFSTDIDNLPNWRPGSDFGASIRLMIGPADGPGEESFDVTVCSPSWLARELESEGIRSGRHMIFMAEFDYASLLRFVERAVHSVEAPDWSGLGEKLSRLGYWEFEDYTP
jgi:hypothetical protein